ncbi:DUF4105 domain-containing protein [Legionella antarctica]|nr:DUF4105 domain-containing protein [Legionella antarctica]
MTCSGRHNKNTWFWKPFCWLTTLIKFLFKLGLIVWAGLAIYYSNLPWIAVRFSLSITFTLFGIWTLWFADKPRMLMIYMALYMGLLVWWSTILPSHDRIWRPEVAVMPRAIITGDKVRFTGFRNFDYRSRDDFTVRYEEREVSLSHLIGLDLYISYWTPGPVGHTFLSFIFDNAAPVSISIETRPEVGEGFSPIGSLFKQFELIYVVGDERDLVRVRTNFRGEKTYLYHIKISSENLRKLFMVYLKRINELADKPEFYNLLSNSCTINILRYANKAGRVGRVDIRHYLNGWIDTYLYAKGWLKTTIFFEELRQRSLINRAARAANKSVRFSQRIRASLPLND